MFKDIETLNKHIKSLKPYFEEYIKNQNIPLEERWEIFLRSTDCLSKHDSFIFHFPFVLPNGSDRDDVDVHLYENHIRGSFKMEDIVEQLSEEQWEFEFIDKIKEYILEHNVKSFDFDW